MRTSGKCTPLLSLFVGVAVVLTDHSFIIIKLTIYYRVASLFFINEKA